MMQHIICFFERLACAHAAAALAAVGAVTEAHHMITQEYPCDCCND